MKKIALLALTFVSCTVSIAASEKWGWVTLIAPQNSTTVTLLDTNSNVVKTWTNLPGQTGYSCYLTPGGFLWRSVKTNNPNFSGGGLCGRVQKIDWNGNVLFDYTISNANEISHHDICPMPNGNVLLIVYEKKTGTQMTAAGCTSNVSKLLEKIVELQPTGPSTANIVWQWNLFDHLCQNTNPNAANYVSSIVQNPQLMNVNYKANLSDWWHMNGIDYNQALDLIVVSAHNTNELYVIDHSTTTAEAAGHTGGIHGKGGDFLYRWGNPAAYDAPGTANFNVIHDAHWVPDNCPNAGWLVGFNNKGISNNHSCVDLINAPWNGSQYIFTPGQPIPPATYNKRIAYTNASGNAGYSSNMSNSQQLPNGNTLICLGIGGYVYEIDSNGNKLWQYTSNTNMAQASRYSRCFIQNPKVTITNIAPAVCPGGTLTLQTSVTATAVNSFTYNWSPATGLSSATVANPMVSGITQPTTYTVTVSTGECTATASVTVGVLTPPNANAGNDVTVAYGQSVTLTASGGVSYVWNNGANTPSITVSPGSTTIYTVTVTDSQGCTASDQVTVYVSGGGLSVSATASPQTICAGASVQLDALPSGGSGNYTYTWSSTAGSWSSTSKNPVANPAANTIYTVTVNDGNSTASASVSVTVHPLPPVSAGNDVVITAGNSVTLTASGAITYQWSNGAQTASHNVTPSVTTTYSVTGYDTNGCSASDEVVVFVSGGPLSVTITSTSDTICLGEASQLFAHAQGGSGIYAYQWASSPAGLNSTLSDPYINPSQTTVYSVTVSDGNSTASASYPVVVLPLPPAPTITLNDTILVSSSPVNNQWFYYGSPISGATGQTLDPTLDGSYQVQVTDSNGCASPISEPFEYIHTSVGTADVNSESTNLYIHVQEQKIAVTGLQHDAGIRMALYDNAGRCVRNVSAPEIFVGDLAEGIYLTIVSNRDVILRRQLCFIRK
ncbi:MAG: aryl-sulfate sulfotransferase [Chitinophagales bacterium]|nr:aryl-sulfate sulfotransferase [Chitinophagales bacterium]MDW8418275.1 aryl-sulfate sulfotransferase [Chitinophagales bacterium]